MDSLSDNSILYGLGDDETGEKTIFFSMPYLWNDDDIYEQFEKAEKITITNDQVVEIPLKDMERIMREIEKMRVADAI